MNSPTNREVAESTAKVTFQASDGRYIVRLNGDRIGIIMQERRGVWGGVDTYFVPIRRKYRTRADLVNALVRRFKKQEAARI